MLPAFRLASNRTKAPSTGGALRTELATRHVAGRRVIQRFQSTSSGSSPSSAGSYIAAGVTGGGIVLLGGYAWYHFSGAKTAVNAARQAHGYYQDTKRSIAEKASKSPNEIIQFFRNIAKSHAGSVPGVSKYVDSAFDTLDELHETHGEEVDRILQWGHDEIRKILNDEKSGVDVQTGVKVMEVLRRSSSQLEEVSKRAGQDALQKLGEKHPEIKDKLGGGYEQLKKAAEKNGPEAIRILNETTSQIKKIFSSGFSPDKVNEAQRLIESKTSEVREAVGGASQEAWNEALEEAAPYLDKLPDIRKLLEEHASAFMAAGLSQESVAREVLARVKDAAQGDVAKSKEKLQELKSFVQKKAEEVRQRSERSRGGGLQALQEWIRSMPGGKEALKKVPDVDLGVLAQVAESRGDEAKKLMGETYEDILKVLKEKAEKAKKVAGKAQEESKEKPA